MRGQLEAWLRASWPSFGVGPLAPAAALRVILVPGGGGEGWRHVGLVMTGSDLEPSIVVKYPRDPGDSERIMSEVASLRRLRTWFGPADERFPVSLATGLVADRTVSVESSAAGEPLLTRMSGGQRRSDTAAARAAGLVDVLIELALHSARDCRPDELRQWVVAPLLKPPTGLIGSAADRARLARLAHRADRLTSQAALPAVFTHCDVGPPNILVNRDGSFASLVDWESAGWGLPLTDVIYLLARLGTAEDDADLTLRRVCRECAIDAEWLPVLIILTWLGHATNESRRDASGTREVESRQRLRRCLDVLAATEQSA